MKRINLIILLVLTHCGIFLFGQQKGNYPKSNKIFVKGGTFQMGSNNSYRFEEKPVHDVTVNDFYIGKYEVTNGQYAEFLNSQGNQVKGKRRNDKPINYIKIDEEYCQIEKINGIFKVKKGKDNYPVIFVSWYGAKAYAEWVGGRLPTEAEWEFAARGGSQTNLYSGSNNIDVVGWYGKNSGKEYPSTKKVGSKQSNSLGIYDMSGNVYEWCQDKWHDNYNGAPTDGSAWEDNDSNYRVMRGGSWYSNFDYYCRVDFRDNRNSHIGYLWSGFRVAFSSK